MIVLPLIRHLDYRIYFHKPTAHKNNFPHVHIINFDFLQENGRLLGFHSMQRLKVPIFQRNVPPPSSGLLGMMTSRKCVSYTVCGNLAHHKDGRGKREDGTCPIGIEDSEKSPFHSINLWEM
jgi:hypothetical protein